MEGTRTFHSRLADHTFTTEDHRGLGGEYGWRQHPF